MQVPTTYPLASVPLRFVAVFIDGLIPSIVYVPLSIIGGIAGQGMSEDAMTGFALVLGLAAFILFVAYLAVLVVMWSRGSSPGKRLLGLRVIRMDTGQPATIGPMLLREIIGKWISGIVCYLGFLWAIWDANKQAWHDKIAGTLVIQER